jgi:2-amino-4-hydroxy-6-hydroxymethyldihydropteridine diphosphokinase
MNILALIGLGSNLGNRKATLDAAVDGLVAAPGVEVRAVSSYHETAPAGGPAGQGAFLNAAVRLETSLDPFVLLGVLRAIEQRAKRTRTVRWGERSLDLDLLIYGCKFLDTSELMLPHPRLAVRRFVLAPLAEIAPTITDTITGRTIAQLLAGLDRRPSYLAVDGPVGPLKDTLMERLAAELGAIALRGSDLGSGGDRRKHPLQCLADNLEARARHLDAGLWPADGLGDRWLVSDFCLGLDHRRMSTLLPEPGTEAAFVDATCSEELIARCQAIRDAVGRALAPTFAVVLGDGPRIARRPRLRPFPLLWPESDDPGALVAEVLASCAASRAGTAIAALPVVDGEAASL